MEVSILVACWLNWLSLRRPVKKLHCLRSTHWNSARKAAVGGRIDGAFFWKGREEELRVVSMYVGGKSEENWVIYPWNLSTKAPQLSLHRFSFIEHLPQPPVGNYCIMSFYELYVRSRRIFYGMEGKLSHCASIPRPLRSFTHYHHQLQFSISNIPSPFDPQTR